MPNRNFDFRQLLSLEACTNCQMCADVCPAVRASGEGELSSVYRLAELKKIVRARSGWFKKLFGGKEPSPEQWDSFAQTVFRCTLCGNCQEVCPVGIDLKEIWLSLRQDLNQIDHYPKKVDMIKDNLEASHNVFDEDNEERAEWVEDCDDPPDDLYCKDEAEVIYFTGCVASFYPLAQEIPVALAQVFEAGKVDFALMGEDEWCCGFPLLGAGAKEAARELIDHNLEAVRERGAKEVVCACPSCYQMWREFYPLGELKLYHATQYLLRLIKDRRLPLKELDMTVTYHDPCDLGRGAREFEAPREILRALPGVKFVELPNNRENCQCCGGGGNLEMIDADLSGSIAQAKIEEVMTTGADAVITSCQQCVRTMTTYVRRNKVNVKVMDITQLIQKALNV